MITGSHKPSFVERLLAVSLLLGAVTGACSSGEPSEPDRVVHLRAENGKFVAEGDENPTIRVERGERTRFVFENTDPGIVHDFRIPAADAAEKGIESGDRVALTVEFEREGQFEYLCDRHQSVMRGDLVVETDEANADQVARHGGHR